ncbi:NTP transferase domain-containing protein [Microbacterium sp. 10M-3C3]|jgi:CTP:molybdopterin cytidylyltransferase MocA|uniref:nucleotidyltransferase family protein n=1 Tax=Microbacterium sp. 10M-3C3 TaxID=2483401 RepID=UPI000F644E13|nr:NTP transferase domain-containing protein [Microbacterium sp. 10M-3C3]
MPEPAAPRVTGVVLAAGAGTRYGGPKALAADAAGVSWLRRVCDALRDGGCGEAVVVLGAAADRALPLVPPEARIAIATDWEAGMSRSVDAGLVAAAGADAVVVAPVDVPGLPAAAVARLIAAGGAEPRAALARATYDGRPGHPALIGADHIAAIRAELRGDVGAGSALARRGARTIECGDLWDGHDIDERP